MDSEFDHFEEETVNMSGFWSWASSIPWVGWVAIAAIVCGCATGITKMLIRHREEMERIRLGDSSSSKPTKPPRMG